MSDHRRTKKTNSFSRALILAVVFGALYLLYVRISERGLPRQFAELVSSEEPAGRAAFFDSTSTDAFYRMCAGFWSAQYRQTIDSVTYTVDDRIEFLDNGIIWRVVEHRYESGSQLRVSGIHTMDAYLRPFQWSTENDSIARCDVRVLRQARSFAADTCLGPENSDVVWECGATAGHFVFRGITYNRFAGDIARFFPAGSIELLESGYERVGRRAQQSGYTVQNGHLVLRPQAKSDEDFSITLDMRRCAHDWWFGKAVFSTTAETTHSAASLLLAGTAWTELETVPDAPALLIRAAPRRRGGERLWTRGNQTDTLSRLAARYLKTPATDTLKLPFAATVQQEPSSTVSE